MKEELFKKSAYWYELPPELIAQHPLQDRESARMMVVDRDSGKIEHRLFRNFPEFLNEGDVVVVNDSRVIHARITLRKEKTGGKVDILILDVAGDKIRAFMERGKKVRPGSVLIHPESNFKFTVLEVKERILNLKPLRPISLDELDALGKIPLPPYIKREPEKEDEEFYQTVFAREKGSIAAPTAGLHFTENTLKKIKDKGADVVSVTLHVSLGTFIPLKTDDIRKHNLYPELCKITPETAEKINLAKASGKKIFAVGTTVVRTLESFAESGRLKAGEKLTDLYITPGFKFQIVDALLTNFHLPGSSLLVLVCAFGGYELIMKAYREAINKRYRFYSYGDCMLIL